MLFVPFFAAYFLLRADNQPWPPEGVELDILRAFAVTAVLVASSFTLVASDRAGERPGGARHAALAAGHDRPRRRSSWPTRSLEYSTLDFSAADHPYGSVYWMLTGLHGAHVTAGLAAMGLLFVRSVRSHAPARSRRGPTACPCSGTSSTSSGSSSSSRSGCCGDGPARWRCWSPLAAAAMAVAVCAVAAPLRSEPRAPAARRRRSLGASSTPRSAPPATAPTAQGVEDRGPSLHGRGPGRGRLRAAHGTDAAGDPTCRRSAGPVRYTEEQIVALVAYAGAFGDGPDIPDVDPLGGDLAAGGELYRLNCAACHVASGAGAAIGGGREAPT